MNFTKKINFVSADKLQKLLGTFDENLNVITKDLGVIARVEGDSIIIEGEQHSVSTAASVIESLLASADGLENLDKGRVTYCLELAKEGRAEEISRLSADTVAVTYRGKQIKCKTLGQKNYVECIKCAPLTFGIGPAGTGKTYLAVCLAVQALKQKAVERIILTRPAVEAGEKLGFLPGDLQDKVDPYLRPLYDALQEMLGVENYTKLMERNTIEIAPLAYMRGRTLSHAFVILDEAQNTTPEQMKMFLTRLGDGSKMVVNGDLTQIDLPAGKSSGLIHAAEILKDVEGTKISYLTEKDVVRNPLVMRIVRAYAADEKRRTEKVDKTHR